MNAAAEMCAEARITNDMVWALQWLDSLTDDLNTERNKHTGEEEHPRTREFLDDLDERVVGNDTLMHCLKEAAFQ